MEKKVDQQPDCHTQQHPIDPVEFLHFETQLNAESGMKP
jgi:hypothetical protein